MTVTFHPTVLIVDDDKLNRAALAELLKDECRLLLAKDGPSALNILMQEDVSLVLLDVSMPGMDGYEVLRRVRENPKTADTSVVFITGMSEEADEERGLLLGAADYVQKPIRPSIVRARIRVHLKLAAQRRELERLSLQDGLTGIANRRYFDDALNRTLRQAARDRETLGLAIIDVDHFKQYNDFYGHGAGDEALRRVARIIDTFAMRPGDVAARYGGEEFVLLMPRIGDFAYILETMRNAILSEGIPHERSPTTSVLTISGGGIVASPFDGTTPQALLDHADKLLYQAKRHGRNRFVLE
ncbi:diguanylate cyclase [Shinella sp. AETb1-6]|uniref:GGDEF domain-containing response regulator n=1 Tax=Shinella sp. AETb1-6 TaxID=2692210 RepID=UPI00136C1B42|nr:diguanylate cyclase [Shinella sp. AETb1-6]MXN52756.1 diguanylate cyclase [Shinella sp. AETb1-6]WLS10527.1 diguanylate cyclase [Shinella sumterensis]